MAAQPPTTEAQPYEHPLTYDVALLFPRQGTWSEPDYWALPETNRIIELAEGTLVVPAMPTTEHQDIVGNIYVALRSYIRAHKAGCVSLAPLPVRLREGIIREPDVLVMLNERLDRITSQYWGPPDLVVEVLSPATQATDRGEKMQEYAQAGVTEYWIVEPETRSVAVHRLSGTTYVAAIRYTNAMQIESTVLPGFVLPVADVFDEDQ
jgi:Uma2 family endonuclease